jgi:lipid-A-disaccharide synthase
MPKIFFSVGEPSGDLHAANLIRSLQTSSERIGAVQPRFRGFGGPRMRDAGCSLDFELTNLAVVGFAEVLPKLREFFRVADIASDVFERDRPDAVVLVDFPGFNWHIAKRAKKFGIPVFYYLPPQLWAWGSWRLRKMRATVDHVLCNLPFEPEWYAKRKMQVEYVGHPFFDEIA